MKAPQFSLKDKDGIVHRLDAFKDDIVVVYFYPRDNTPGCTIEASQFTAALSKFKKLGAAVVGISGGDEKSKTKFCEKHDLKVLLLSDPDFAVAKAYGAYGKKKFMGREFMGIFRNTYIIDQKREIVKVFEKVKAATHVQEVLDYLEG